MKRVAGLHVAVIMDGNGRWATSRGLPRIAGHRAGVVAVSRVVETALARGIERLTLYAFSSDNWRRPTSEVQGIFGLLRVYLRKEVKHMREQDIRLQIIGRRDRLASEVLKEIELAESETRSCRRLRLCLAIDYSSRNSISRAAAKAMAAIRSETTVDRAGEVLAECIASETKNVDLLIRTGGEKRLSDFLLWESAYAELLFSDRMWPEFDGKDLDAALEEFGRRERRFGAIPETPRSKLLTGT
ncbi:MAG: polyprenyl diphosphate synthase [Bryobacteraceae bacterium]